MRRAQGFTLLEVMIAVFVFATVIGGLVSLVSANLSRLGEARRELDRMERAERLLREVETEARLGVPPELGTTGELFEPPDHDLRWEREVTAFALPVPEELAGGAIPYKVFATPSPAEAADPNAAMLRLVRVWVFPDDAERDDFDPFELIVAPAPPPSATPEGVEEATGVESQVDEDAEADPDEPSDSPLRTRSRQESME
jgi:prepilin-type N-terminal cleavage/methylation domain-containing protein